MKKILAASALALVWLSNIATAGQVSVLLNGGATALPSCGGDIQVSSAPLNSNQVNIKFSKVSNCDTFEVSAKEYSKDGATKVKISSDVIKGQSQVSVLDPDQVLAYGTNNITIRIQSTQNPKTRDTVRIERNTDKKGLNYFLSLSDSELLDAAKGKTTGKCLVVANNSPSNYCPFYVRIKQKTGAPAGYPNGTGCAESIHEAASLVRQALQSGLCF